MRSSPISKVKKKAYNHGKPKAVKTFFLTAVALLIASLSFGQAIDSLESQLENDQLTEEQRLQILQLLSRELVFVDPVKSLSYTNTALSIATVNNDSLAMAKSYRILAAISRVKGSYYLAMRYHQRSQEIFEEKQDSIGIANSYISLGHIYRRLHRREEEIEYHKKSFDAFQKLRIPNRIGVTAHNLGESYYNAGQFQKARALTKYAIAINDSINNQLVLSSSYKVLGLIALAQSNLEEAEQNFQKVLQISNEQGKYSQKYAEAEALLGLAHLASKGGDLKKEIEYLEKVISFSKENELGDYLRTALENLTRLYTHSVDTELAESYLGVLKKVSDSLRNKALQDRFYLTSSVVEIHDLSEANKELEIENLLQTQRAAAWTTATIALTMLLVIILILLLKFRKVNRELLASKKLIRAQNNDLRALNQTKDKFFGIVAHDLKSPLFTLLDYSGLLIHNFDQLKKEQIMEMNQHLKHSAENTIKLADNLIKWAQIQMEEAKCERKVFDADTVLSNMIKVYKETAEQKQIALTYEKTGDSILYADKDHLKFIIRNLLNNAIKFTSEGGTVSIKLLDKEPNLCSFIVQDSGVGMSQDKIDSLFKFGKATSTRGTAKEKGTGLGLMLIFEFLKLNEGQIEIESTPNIVTTISVSFLRS